MPSNLWTPEGVVSLERDVVALNEREVRLLSDLAAFAQKHHIVIFCKSCEKNISGHNNDSPDTTHVSVACGCREWRFTLPGR